MLHKHGLATNSGLRFLRIAGTSDAENSVRGKAECFAIGEDKKVSFL